MGISEKKKMDNLAGAGGGLSAAAIFSSFTRTRFASNSRSHDRIT